jgi:hypothetical protein
MLEDTINMIDIEYKINENELVVIKNLLLPDGKNSVSYFDNLETFHKNKYVHTITYDNAQPYTTKIIDEPLDEIKQQPINVNENECIVSEGEVVGNIQKSIWKKFFTSSKEIIFSSADEKCTFEVLFSILLDYDQELYNNYNSILLIKTKLVTIYKKYAQYLPALMDIWYNDKKITKKQIITMTIKDVETFILSDKHFITDIDIWLIADDLNLPIVLFCVMGLKLLKFKGKISWIALNELDTNTYHYFIRSPSEDSIGKTLRPTYQLIMPKIKPTFLEDKKIIDEQTESLTKFLRKLSK